MFSQMVEPFYTTTTSLCIFLKSSHYLILFILNRKTEGVRMANNEFSFPFTSHTWFNLLRERNVRERTGKWYHSYWIVNCPFGAFIPYYLVSIWKRNKINDNDQESYNWKWHWDVIWLIILYLDHISQDNRIMIFESIVPD